MAAKTTIYKIDLQLQVGGGGQTVSHPLVMARHPSETDQRLALRLLVFALCFHPDLAFGRGLSTPDEPVIWRKNLSGEVELWVELGELDERRIRKARGRAREVVLFCYGGQKAEMWWSRQRKKLGSLENLTVVNIPVEPLAEFAAMLDRNMTLACQIDDGAIQLVRDDLAVTIVPELWMGKLPTMAE